MKEFMIKIIAFAFTSFYGEFALPLYLFADVLLRFFSCCNQLQSD